MFGIWGYGGKIIKAPEPTASEYGMDGAKEGVVAASGQRNPRLIGSHHNGQVDCAKRQSWKQKSLSHVRHGICLKPLFRGDMTRTAKALTLEADDFD